MGDSVDRALSENHALITAILDHYSAGRPDPAVALLERLQMNLESIAAVAEHGIPLAYPTPSHHPQPLPQCSSSLIPTPVPPLAIFQQPLPSAANPTDHPPISTIPPPYLDSQHPELIPPLSAPTASALRTAPPVVPSSTVALLPRGRPAPVALAPADARPSAPGPSTPAPQPNRTIAPAPLPPRTSGMGSGG